MDAKQISDALGGLNLGKPPLGPGGGGSTAAAGDAGARQSSRLEAVERSGLIPCDLMPSPGDWLTPRGPPKGENGRPPRSIPSPFTFSSNVCWGFVALVDTSNTVCVVRGTGQNTHTHTHTHPHTHGCGQWRTPHTMQISTTEHHTHNIGPPSITHTP